MEARSQQTGVVIPGPFVQFAADNNDFNEETLDGKQTTHSTTLVVYQRQPFGPKPPPKIHADHTSRRRSLEQPVQGPLMHECSVRGKRPPLMSFVGRAEESFVLDEDSTAAENLRELAWFLLRLNRKDVFKADDTCGEQSILGWSAFNAMTSSITLPRTVIEYCPMIAGSPTEYSTIYTVLKTVQEMSKQLHQSTAVITFDLAIYSKAKEIQLRYPEEFQHLVIRLGGFHIALNYLALIGKVFQESGLEDVFIESGLYGSSSTMALLQGKSYNRRIRGHKLVMEALLRLQWEAFCSWIKKGGGVDDTEDEGSLNLDLVNSVVERYRAATSSEEKKEAYHVLCNSTKHVGNLFKFWDKYIEMVLLLLKFIRAEREGDWEQHLKVTTKMIPYFFAMDRLNYSRWLPVCTMDMRHLQKTALDVYNEFVRGNHTVSRSTSQSFNQVWTDMALEQSVNLDSKTKGGIIGISQRPGALQKWFLTAHERTATTTATKRILDMDESTWSTHKESSRVRVQRDEGDINKVIHTLKTVMSNPFDEDANGEDMPLMNIAAGVVMPEEMSKQLLDSSSSSSSSLFKLG